MSGVDDRAGSADVDPAWSAVPETSPAGTTAELGEALPVAPVLVRDYRRLLRLFPYTYRRAHEVEMLGHLLDGARPGQSRPTPGERWDLVRAAAREWLLAPLGSTPRQRQASTAVLAALLPVFLAFPMGRALGSLAGTLLMPARRQYVLEWAPAAPTWVLWAVALVLLLTVGGQPSRRALRGAQPAGRALPPGGATPRRADPPSDPAPSSSVPTDRPPPPPSTTPPALEHDMRVVIQRITTLMSCSAAGRRPGAGGGGPGGRGWGWGWGWVRLGSPLRGGLLGRCMSRG